MSEFKNKSITVKGMELLSKALSGETLEFTKVELGSGDFTGDIGEVSALIQLKQSLPITKITRKGSQVTLSTTLKIEDIATSFDWSEIGVYAKGNDGVEILYMYGYTENTSYISKDSLNEKLINVTVMVSNVAEVTAKIDSSLVYLTDEALKEHNVDQVAHKDIRAEVKALQGQLNNIDISWQSIQGKPTTFPPTSHAHNEYLASTQKGVFRQIADLGLTSTNFSTTDVGANMYKIFNAMPAYCVVMDRLNATALYTNLYTSIIAKATTDLGLTTFVNNDIIIKFEAGLGTNLSNKVTIRDNQSYKEYAFIYDRAGTKDEVSKIYQTFGEGTFEGDIMGKTIKHESLTISYPYNTYTELKSYTNTKGGMARVHAMSYNTNRNIPTFKLVVDGQVIFDGITLYEMFGVNTSGTGAHYFDIPFKESFTLYYKDSYGASVTKVSITYYLKG